MYDETKHEHLRPIFQWLTDPPSPPVSSPPCWLCVTLSYRFPSWSTVRPYRNHVLGDRRLSHFHSMGIWVYLSVPGCQEVVYQCQGEGRQCHYIWFHSLRRDKAYLSSDSRDCETIKQGEDEVWAESGDVCHALIRAGNDKCLNKMGHVADVWSEMSYDMDNHVHGSLTTQFITTLSHILLSSVRQTPDQT